MPADSSHRPHRGRHPLDADAFTAEHLPALRSAVNDLSWLLTRGYAPASSLKLIGDRHALTARQRLAVTRAACSDKNRETRQARLVPVESIAGAAVEIDAFNLLITLESALSGGILLQCRDGCLRDMSSIHGSYHAVQETAPAVEMLGRDLAALGPASVTWFLDKPVSNSGRLSRILRELAAAHAWPWQVELVNNPDHVLARTEAIVVTSDSVILDRCARWCNLASWWVRRHCAALEAVTLDAA
jgi:hypothetical protein